MPKKKSVKRKVVKKSASSKNKVWKPKNLTYVVAVIGIFLIWLMVLGFNSGDVSNSQKGVGEDGSLAQSALGMGDREMDDEQMGVDVGSGSDQGACTKDSECKTCEQFCNEGTCTNSNRHLCTFKDKNGKDVTNCVEGQNTGGPCACVNARNPKGCDSCTESCSLSPGGSGTCYPLPGKKRCPDGSCASICFGRNKCIPECKGQTAGCEACTRVRLNRPPYTSEFQCVSLVPTLHHKDCGDGTCVLIGRGSNTLCPIDCKGTKDKDGNVRTNGCNPCLEQCNDLGGGLKRCQPTGNKFCTQDNSCREGSFDCSKIPDLNKAA